MILLSSITRNPDGSIKVVIKDVTGIIIGEDVGTIVDEAAVSMKV